MISKIKYRFAFLWLIVLAFSFSACAPVVKGEQTGADSAVDVAAGHWIGQSLMAGYRGLSGVEVLINPQEADRKLTLSLYSDAFMQHRLASSTLQIHKGDEQVYYRFAFPPIKDSTNADYYFEIQVDGNSPVRFFTTGGANYLEGSLYQDHLPQDAQLTFRLAYDPLEYAWGLALEFLGWGWLWLLAGFGFVLPGWGMLSNSLDESWPDWRWTEKLALSAGVGLASYPVIMLWAKLAHLRLGMLYAWLPACLAAVYLLWKNRKNIAVLLQNTGLPGKPGLPSKPSLLRARLQPRLDDLVFVALFLAILFVRFWVIRGIDVPMWGDSYQHTMIAQLMVDQGGLFNSWRPYVPYQSLTVQYGFPAGTAVWMWLTGTPSPQATLVFGQLLNAFAILSLYPLALLVSRGNRWAGNASLLIGGLLSSMPAFYVNWGRYAQLMGQAILPAAICLVWYWLENPRFHWKQLLIQGISIVGMLLAYYRMAFYYAAFIPILLGLFLIWGPVKNDWRYWRTVLVKLAAMGIISLILVSPWLSNLFGSNLSTLVESGITHQSPAEAVLADYQIWTKYQDYIGVGLVLLCAASLLVSSFMKRWEIAGLVLWAGLVSAIRAATLIHLPGANTMQSFAVLISLYIFASLIGGWLIGLGLNYLVLRRVRLGLLFALALALFLGLAFYGFNVQRKIANPLVYAIAARPDVRAMDWIRSQTVPGAVFLVEGFRIYSGTSAVGSDAGWWIPLLASRQNTMPPQYALVNEQPDPPNYTKRVVDLVAQLETHSLTDPSLRADLCQWGVTHIYIGQKQGRAGSETFQLFPPAQNSPFRLAYAQDRVRIYSIPEDYCLGLPPQ